MEYNVVDKLDNIRLALIKAAEAHNALTEAYNTYVDELKAVYDEVQKQKETTDE